MVTSVGELSEHEKSGAEPLSPLTSRTPRVRSAATTSAEATLEIGVSNLTLTQ